MSDYGLSSRGSYSSGPRGRGGRGGRGQRGGSQRANFGRGRARGGRGRGMNGGRGRGMSRGRGRSVKPPVYQEYDCGHLCRLASRMNADNSFYNFCTRSVHTEGSVQEHREQCLQSMIVNDQVNGGHQATVTLPDDFRPMMDDLISKKKTEEAYSNSWPISGSFFENCKFHG